ncbi:MAG: hypothetical protein ABI720_07410 [Actinomycetes bacterium]
MRWFSRRSQPEAPKGRHAAGRVTPVRVISTLPVEPASTLPLELPPTLPREPVPALGSGVHLGFADGSRHELSPGDPRVMAFRAVARTLVGI